MAATTTEEFSFGTQSTVQLANQYDMSQSWTLSFDFTVSPANQSKSLTILSTDGLKMSADNTMHLPRVHAAGLSQDYMPNDRNWMNGGTYTCTMVYDSASDALTVSWGSIKKTLNGVDFGSNVLSSFTTDLTNPSLGSGWGISGGTITGEAIAANPDAPVAPEPTTATLSLLALAGLAARRRRK